MAVENTLAVNEDGSGGSGRAVKAFLQISSEFQYPALVLTYMCCAGDVEGNLSLHIW